MKHSFFISLMLLSIGVIGTPAHAQITGWDEVGPTISGQKYGFGDLGIKTEKLTAVRKANRWGFVTPDNKTKIKPKYDAIGDTVCFLGSSIYTDNALHQSGILVKEKGKWGLVGFNGKVLIKPEYDSLGDFFSIKFLDYGTKYALEGRTIAKSGKSQYIINTSGKKLKTISPDIIEVINVGTYILGIKADGSLQVVDSPERSDISVYTSDNCLYKINDRYNRRDVTYFYRPLKEFFVEDLTNSHRNGIGNGITIASNNNGKIAIIKNNVLLSDSFYTDINRFDNNSFYLTREDGTSDFLCGSELVKTGKTIREGVYGDYLIYSNPGEKTIGVMNAKGQIITEPIYTSYSKLEANVYGEIALNIGDEPRLIITKWVDIDGKKGMLELPEGCESITFDPNDTVVYDVAGKKGYAKINIQNCTFVMPFSNYKYSQYGSGNYYIVSTDGEKWGVVDTENNNKVMLPIVYDSISRMSLSYYRITKNGQSGVFNMKDCKTIVPVGRYKKIVDIQNGFIVVKNGNKYGLVSLTGTQIVPPSYDNLVAYGNNNIMVVNKVANGEIAYIYSQSGKLLKQQKFTNSQANSYWARVFLTDWLGGYPQAF